MLAGGLAGGSVADGLVSCSRWGRLWDDFSTYSKSVSVSEHQFKRTPIGRTESLPLPLPAASIMAILLRSSPRCFSACARRRSASTSLSYNSYKQSKSNAVRLPQNRVSLNVLRGSADNTLYRRPGAETHLLTFSLLLTPPAVGSATRCFFVGGSLLTRFSACSFARSSTLPWMSVSLAFLSSPCSWGE